MAIRTPYKGVLEFAVPQEKIEAQSEGWFRKVFESRKFLLAALLMVIPFSCARAQSNAKIVFLIVIVNRNWIGSGGTSGSAEAPYINKTLVPIAASPTTISTLRAIIPAYLIISGWRRARTLECTTTDCQPIPSEHARPSERAFAERGSSVACLRGIYLGTDCPLTPQGAKDSSGSNLYQPRHFPQIYFDDMTGARNPDSSYCIQRTRPLASLASDLKENKIGRYNFVTPDMCHDGHDPCGGNESHILTPG